MIQIHQVSKAFGPDHYVVRDVSLEVHDGEILVLLGSSGCGKTTILNMINRLLEPSSGIIEIDGQDIQKYDPIELRRQIGYVFQGVGLFPHMTVEENVSMVLQLQGVDAQERHARASELLTTVNLNPETFLTRYPHELSGGQRQRVGVARALASRPKYMLMDEPFGALDAVNREAMQHEIIGLVKRLQKTIVFVTHDIFEALRIGDRIAVMNNGKIEQVGTQLDLLEQPATPFVASLMQTVHQHVEDFQEQVT